MGAPEKKARPIWVRHNPRDLTEEELAAVRATPHLGDLDMPKLVFKALIWGGHRYIGELAYVSPKQLRELPGMNLRLGRSLYLVAAEHKVDIGIHYKDRVHVPQ